MHPKLSVCIPVFNSEPYLSFCLESVANQTFFEYEIVLVNDASSGKDSNGKSCKQIVKAFCKNHRKIKVNYIQNSKNLGTLETRRIALINAKAAYVFYLDSDDFLPPDALESVYNAAVQNNADVVQAKIFGGNFPDDTISAPIETFVAAQKQKLTAIHIGTLQNREVFTNLFVEKTMASCLCGKLFLRELLLQAYEQIPFVNLCLQEDMLVSFFAGLHAKKYVGLDKIIYYYRQTSGMTSGAQITSLKKWEMQCSSSSAYHIILNYVNENKEQFTELEIASLQQLTRVAVRLALYSLESTVASEIRPQARQMLNEYWGKGIVDRVENQIKEEMQKNDKPTN